MGKESVLRHLRVEDLDTGEIEYDGFLTEDQRFTIVDAVSEEKEDYRLRQRVQLDHLFFKVSKNFYRVAKEFCISKADTCDLFIIMKDLSRVDNSLNNSGHKYSTTRISKVLGISRETARQKLRSWENANIIKVADLFGKRQMFVNPNYFSCGKYVLKCVADLFEKGEDNGRSKETENNE